MAKRLQKRQIKELRRTHDEDRTKATIDEELAKAFDEVRKLHKKDDDGRQR